MMDLKHKAELLMKLLEDPEIAENFSIVECCVRVSDEGFAKLLQAIEQAPKEPNEALKRLMMNYKNPAAFPDNESTSPDTATS